MLIIVLTKSPMEDPGPGTFFQINGLKSKTLGRGSTADIRIKHASISREHIRFVPETHTWFIEDLGSRNGTFLNDEPLKGKKILQKGFRLNVGLFHFKVCSASRPTTEKKASQTIKKSAEPIIQGEPIAVPQTIMAKPEPVKTKPPAWFNEDLIRHPDDHEPAVAEYGGGSEQDNLGTGIFPSMTEEGWGVNTETEGSDTPYVADSYEPDDDYDEPFSEDRPAKARATPRKASSKKRVVQDSADPDWPADSGGADDSKDRRGPAKPRRPIPTHKMRRDKITDADLTALENFTDMSSLNLSGSQITDVGLKYLKKLPHLRSLDLEGTHVTDQGIEHLVEMSHLTFLDLTDTGVSDQGIETLLKSLTLCRVVY